MGLDLSAGNKILTQVSYEAANNQADFSVLNLTTGQGRTSTESLNGTWYDGSTGDFIDERPFNGTFEHLQNFGQVGWNLSQVQVGSTGSWSNLGAESHVRTTMVEASTTLAHASDLSDPNSFTDNWDACSGN